MRRIKVAAVLSAIALFLSMTTLSAAPQGRGRRGGAFDRIPSRQLGVTDAQRQQLQSIAQAHRDETNALRQRLDTARAALRQATAAVPLDNALAKQRRADLSAVQADRTALRARVHAEMLQVLTPDQQAQLKQLQDRMRNRRQRRQR
jgi:periplasmic protein CpxP/Spy